jgi:hypothetical protein
VRDVEAFVGRDVEDIVKIFCSEKKPFRTFKIDSAVGRDEKKKSKMTYWKILSSSELKVHRIHPLDL